MCSRAWARCSPDDAGDPELSGSAPSSGITSCYTASLDIAFSKVSILRYPDAITEIMGTVRFSKIVEVAGKPIVRVGVPAASVQKFTLRTMFWGFLE